MEPFYVIGSSARWRTLRSERAAVPLPEQTKLPGLSGPGPEELSTTHLSRWRGARYHGLFLRVFKRDMHPFVFCVCVRVWVSWMP